MSIVITNFGAHVNEPIHTVLVNSSLLFTPPITITLLFAVLTAAVEYLADGMRPMVSQL